MEEEEQCVGAVDAGLDRRRSHRALLRSHIACVLRAALDEYCLRRRPSGGDGDDYEKILDSGSVLRATLPPSSHSVGLEASCRHSLRIAQRPVRSGPSMSASTGETRSFQLIR